MPNHRRDSVDVFAHAIIQPLVILRERNVLKVETEILENRQARIIATVEPERVQQELRNAARRIAKKVNIPGFRKGKAPYHIIAQFVGEDYLFEEALDDLGQAVYLEALKESGVEPYSSGTLENIEREPFTMTFTVPLVPEIELGDYRSIRVDYEEPEVPEEEIERTLQELRDQHATLTPVERAIQMGDIALLDIKGTLVRGEEADEEEAQERNDIWLNRIDVRVKIAEDATYPVAGFPQKVVGMAAGDESTFEISFGEEEDIPEALRGKTLNFEVKCKEVYEYSAPELDDEFAKEVADFETLEELRADIRNELEKAAQRSRRNEYLNQIFDELFEKELVRVSYPDVMLEEQIDHMIRDFEGQLRQQGLSLKEYRKLQKVTDQQIRDDMREEAKRQLKQALALGEIAEAEELSVKEAEIDAEIEEMIRPFGEQAEFARQLFSSPESRNSIANRILAEKTLDRLIAIARGENPPIGEPVVEEEEAAEEEVTADADAEAVAEAEVQANAELEAEAAAETAVADEEVEAAEEQPEAAAEAPTEAETDNGNEDVDVDGSEEPGTTETGTLE